MRVTQHDFSGHFSLAELLVHALVIELEAVQSYKELATQMQQCGNSEVADVFQQMSVLEAGHAKKIREKAGDIALPELAPWEYRWPGLEPPENIDQSGVHYLMTPHQALDLALENELNALAFFEAIADGSADERVRSLAREFAEDERQHVAWMEDWLTKYPEPPSDWDYDPDPPAALD
ncbi:MAG: ferritin family protein [Woeseia sp.]